MTESEVRAALRAWVAERNPGLAPDDLTDQTRLIERRYLTSLQVADLLLHIEELRHDPLEPDALRPGVFATVDAIYEAFFGSAGPSGTAGSAAGPGS